jgi:putative oxidoreductase
VSTFGEIVLLVGRILFAALFVYSARGHYTSGPAIVGYSRASGVPFPALAAWPAALWLLAGSASIVLGVLPDVGALMLAAFLVPAAAYLHRFWNFDDPQQRREQEMSFFRNLSLLGACLCLLVLFATVGHEIDLTFTEPAFDLR